MIYYNCLLMQFFIDTCHVLQNLFQRVGIVGVAAVAFVGVFILDIGILYGKAV